MKYTVLLDGREISLQPARTSRIAFNRVWPGKQRDLSQTEISYFVSFDMTAPVTLTVDVDTDIESADILPRDFGIEYFVTERQIVVHLEKPRKFVIEVNGIEEALHVFANAPVKLPKRSADVLYFAKGEHDVAMIYPHDNQTIFLEEGAVVYGGICAVGVKGLKVLGRGVLDSSKLPRGEELDRDADPMALKMKSLGLTDTDVRYYSAFVAYNCENLTLDGIILRDAPFWTVIVRNGCRNVSISNIKIIGQWRYNSDGIDLCTSENVTVDDCFVRAFDDCIVVRGVHLPGESADCRNNVITNNVLWCDWGKNLEIWSGHHNSRIDGVRFADNRLIHVCRHAISIDTWNGAPDIVVENVEYENISIDTTVPIPPVYQRSDDQEFTPPKNYIPNGVYINVSLGMTQGGLGDGGELGIRYRNIRFKNVACTGGAKLPVRINRKNLRELSGITMTDCVLGDLEIK